MLKRRTSRVFVAGGQPTVTYVDRANLRLEAQLSEFIDTGYTLISVTGPTKSGKTVLCRSVIAVDEAVWIGGGEIGTESEFWERLAGELGQYNEIEEAANKSRSKTDTFSGEGGVNFGIAKVGAGGSSSDTATSASTMRRVRRSSTKMLALEALNDFDKAIVIDDFHYISSDVQRSIVRALKQKIFDGLNVIVLAVPHRAYDAVRVETEMTGRVRHLSLGRWEDDDLRSIAAKGFPELNVECKDEIVRSFVENCFSSPHLMQWFCNKVCIQNGVIETQSVLRKLNIENFSEFYSDVAANTAKTAFDRLATGPRQRTDRMVRKFQDGTEGDIYIAVLKAIAASGPKLTMTYEDIRMKLRDVIVGDLPQAHEISRVLVKMTEIARHRIEGEPVLEWSEDEKILHIIDPFFAFYLRWGALVRPGK